MNKNFGFLFLAGLAITMGESDQAGAMTKDLADKSSVAECITYQGGDAGYILTVKPGENGAYIGGVRRINYGGAKETDKYLVKGKVQFARKKDGVANKCKAAFSIKDFEKPSTRHATLSLEADREVDHLDVVTDVPNHHNPSFGKVKCQLSDEFEKKFDQCSFELES